MIVSSFDSRDLTFLTAVLEQACSGMEDLDESRRQAIAARIMHLAQTGERDFEVLREYATALIPRDQRKLPRLDQILLARRHS